MTDILDAAIIGGGPAGLSAAQYSARANLKTAVFEKSTLGGQCLLISHLENYPGLVGMSGVEFVQQMQAQTTQFGAQLRAEEVTELVQYEATRLFTLRTSGGTYQAKVVIAATGTEHRVLMIPGEKEFFGHGVSYCASCDGPFFKNKRILVVGGGDAACDEALFLSSLSPHITMIHRRDAFRAQKAVAQRVLDNKNINILWYTELKKIHGDQSVRSVTLYHNDTQTTSTLDVDAVFIFIGSSPQERNLFHMVTRDAQGYIITDQGMRTNIAGLFAIGDVRNTLFRQIVTACADGAIAAHEASRYIRDLARKAQ